LYALKRSPVDSGSISWLQQQQQQQQQQQESANGVTARQLTVAQSHGCSRSSSSAVQNTLEYAGQSAMVKSAIQRVV
jgi:PDZ domain-containing secreted protein